MKSLVLVQARKDVEHFRISFIKLLREACDMSLSGSKAAFEEF